MMEKYTRPKIEVADIFNKYGADYREKHKLPLQSLKVMSAIENCRTIALGGHIDKCDNCGYEYNSYNSCRNRHCPKCQGMPQIKWVEKRIQELLPVKYFHLKMLKDDTVTFQWKDYADNNKIKLMTLQVHEFIRRFLLHVLPSGFFKIRYYGLLSSRNKKSNIELCRKLLGVITEFIDKITQTWQELLFEYTGINVDICPKCKKGRMKLFKILGDAEYHY